MLFEKSLKTHTGLYNNNSRRNWHKMYVHCKAGFVFNIVEDVEKRFSENRVIVAQVRRHIYGGCCAKAQAVRKMRPSFRTRHSALPLWAELLIGAKQTETRTTRSIVPDEKRGCPVK